MPSWVQRIGYGKATCSMRKRGHVNIVRLSTVASDTKGRGHAFGVKRELYGTDW